jgi:hypothetical protein
VGLEDLYDLRSELFFDGFNNRIRFSHNRLIPL